jgi:hypothetical protein
MNPFGFSGVVGDGDANIVRRVAQCRSASLQWPGYDVIIRYRPPEADHRPRV